MCVCVYMCVYMCVCFLTLLRQLVWRFPVKWYLNLFLRGTSIIWMGRERGGASWERGGA